MKQGGGGACKPTTSGRGRGGETQGLRTTTKEGAARIKRPEKKPQPNRHGVDFASPFLPDKNESNQSASLEISNQGRRGENRGPTTKAPPEISE